jgi:hypothetical protein
VEYKRERRDVGRGKGKRTFGTGKKGRKRRRTDHSEGEQDKQELAEAVQRLEGDRRKATNVTSSKRLFPGRDKSAQRGGGESSAHDLDEDAGKVETEEGVEGDSGRGDVGPVKEKGRH